MVISGKGVNNYLYIKTKSPNKKQKARTAITENNKQHFSNFLKKVENSPYMGYKSKQIHNEPTDDYFFLIKHITKIIKIQRHVRLCSQGFKSGVNKKIGHVNKKMYTSTKEFNIRN